MADGNGGIIARYAEATLEAPLLWNNIHQWKIAAVACAPIAATKPKKNHPESLPGPIEVFLKAIHVKHHGNLAVQTDL
jgi:hypothetical protein